MLRPITVAIVAALSLVGAPTQAQETIDMEPEYITVFREGSDEWKLINEFSRELAERQHRTGTVMLAALDNFENTMSFPSSAEATPKVAAAMLKTVFEEGLSEAAKGIDEALFAKVPVVGTLTKTLKAASDEIDRAAKAAASHKVGKWIREQRRIISDTVVGGGDTSAEIEGEIKQAFRALDESDREEVIYLMGEQLERLQAASSPAQVEFERAIFEGWINAHWDGMRGADGGKTDGVIDVRWEVEEEDGMLVFDGDERTTWVAGDFGDKLVDGLNEVMAGLDGVSTPLDFRVNKRVCFYVENLVGGTSWSCGWLDRSNGVRSAPLLPIARRAMESPVWRKQTVSFKE